MGLVAKDQGEMLRSVHDVVPAETGDCGDAGGPLHSSMNGDTMTICVAGVWQCSRAGGEPPVAPAVATSESSPPFDNGALNKPQQQTCDLRHIILQCSTTTTHHYINSLARHAAEQRKVPRTPHPPTGSPAALRLRHRRAPSHVICAASTSAPLHRGAQPQGD